MFKFNYKDTRTTPMASLLLTLNIFHFFYLGWKDGPMPFHRTLLATGGGPTSTCAVDYYLKVKDIEYDVVLTKNYCLTVSMQKIGSIHKLIL